jgi:hypothetical protein
MSGATGLTSLTDQNPLWKAQLVQNCTLSTEHKGSLRSSREPGSYVQPVGSSPHSLTLFLIRFNNILPLHLGFPSGLISTDVSWYCVYLSNVCYMLHPSHLPWPNHSNDPNTVLHLNTSSLFGCFPTVNVTSQSWVIIVNVVHQTVFGYKQKIEMYNFITSGCP